MTHGLLIFILAGVGALLRSTISQKLNADLPTGTLLVNVMGSVLIGWVLTQTTWPLSVALKTAVAVGFLGALTTYSSFAFEIVQFIEKGRWGMVVAYIGLTQVLAVLGCYLGVRLTRVLGL